MSKQKFRFYVEDFDGNISVIESDSMTDIIDKHIHADLRIYKFVSAVICYTGD